MIPHEAAARGGLQALLLRRERKLQAVEASIAAARRADTEASAGPAADRAQALEVGAIETQERHRATWDTAVRPVINKMVAATESLNVDGLRRSADALSRGLGLRSKLARDEDVLAALTDPTVPMRLGRAPARATSQLRPDRLLERLGPTFDPPRSWVEAARRDVGTREALHDPPQCGLQLTRRGAARGGLYNHHGVCLTDGTVVHFNAEKRRKRNGRIRRQAFEEFLADQDLGSVRAVSPVRVRARSCTSMRGPIVALRALQELGRGGYAFLEDNCEHFANWACLGAEHSAQTHVAGQVRRLIDAFPPIEAFVHEVLRQDVELTSEAVDVRIEAPRDPIVLDLGRAFWSPDVEDVVLWLPVWSEPALAPAALDHQWRMGGLAGALDSPSWAPFNPATFLDAERHWSLVAVIAGAWDDEHGDQRLCWIGDDGIWRKEARGPEELLSARLHHCERLFEALGRSLVETIAAAVRLAGHEPIDAS